jgi:hypothetical protein
VNEELEILKDVAVRLNGAGIGYMMTGSMAMALYSIPRMTRDIDVVVQILPADAGKIATLFSKDFYVDEAVVLQAIRDKGMFNIIHTDSVVKVDFIIRKDEDYRIEEFSRKKKIVIDGVPVWVVAPEDLVLSKLVWAKNSGSELQFRDVRQMMTRNDFDERYLQKWAKALGVVDLVERAKSHE